MIAGRFCAVLLAILAALGCCYAQIADGAPARMIVLGVDGMDPDLLRELLDDGDLPNLKALIEMGGFKPLGTSNPPQSPVAWSNFITGMNPGGHGLFDFIALDRDQMTPYLSASTVKPGRFRPIKIGKWRIPISSDQTVLLRNGTAFWELLEEAGSSVTIFRIPANYPPVPTSGDSLSGMGIPDLLGSSGTFTFLSTRPGAASGPVSGGNLAGFEPAGDHLIGKVAGPPNPFLDGAPSLYAELEVYPDPSRHLALVRVGDEEVLLQSGEWSDWLTIHFGIDPGLVSVTGMVRLFLQNVHPYTELYISPVNIDPRNPALPISSPDDYAIRLADVAGPFYTQEMPEDTKALSAHVLSPNEFLQQSALILDERRRLLDLELDRFMHQEGDAFLFFYFSSVDQRNHMMAAYSDIEHPAFSGKAPRVVREAMNNTYREIDSIVGSVVKTLEDNVGLVVMSDHGFSDFHRQAHLNTWLHKHGYLHRKTGTGWVNSEWLSDIDWSKTRAFAIGLNSLYLNVEGREREGIVSPTERLDLARQITSELMEWVDDKTGLPVVTNAVTREEVYRGEYLGNAPDIIVGYGNGYRASWATTKGQTPPDLVEDNLEEWSGDHCVDPEIVPGVLLTNLKLHSDVSQLTDLTVGILDYFGIKPPQLRTELQYLALGLDQLRHMLLRLIRSYRLDPLVQTMIGYAYRCETSLTQ